MKERPILFSGEMVRSILGDRKKQTRRIVKPLCGQPVFYAYHEGEPYPYYFRRKDGVWDSFKTFEELAAKYCPYGVKGDRLWVRETWAPVQPLVSGELQYDSARLVEIDGYPIEVWYRADGELGVLAYVVEDGPRWKPSIHMPRSASRITLEITDVRLQRLQDISEEDAIAEGVEPLDIGCRIYRDYLGHGGDYPGSDYLGFKNPIDSFRTLWDSIYSDRSFSWDSNPWVWVIEFKKINP